MQSETIGELAKALAKAQGEIKGATKDAQNPHFRAKYADLASVWEACRGPLSANGLSVIQTTDGDGTNVEVITTLAHSSGQWIRGKLVMRPVKADPQGIGSALTYARRYSLAAMVGVAPEDDDGEGAHGRGYGRRETPPPKRDDTPPPHDDDGGDPTPTTSAVQGAIAFRDSYINSAKGARTINALADLAKQHGAKLDKLRAAYPALWKEIAGVIAQREADFEAEQNLRMAG